MGDLKRRFIEHFSGVHSREASVAAFRSIVYKPGESLESYMGRIKPLAERLGYQGELVKDQFLHGLSYDVKVAVSMAGCDTIEGMVIAAQRFVDLQTGRASTREVTFAVNETEAVRSEIENMREDLRSLRVDNDRKKREDSGFSRGRRRPNAGVSPNRWAKRPSGQASRTGRCNYCNEQGHFWRQCRMLAMDMERGSVRARSKSGDRGRANNAARPPHFR